MHMLQFVLGLLAMTWSCAKSRRGDLRVYKGELDTLNEFPFLVSIEMVYTMRNNTKRIYFICTGSLIADNWVLTAAHCLDDEDEFIIRYGDFTKPSTETKLYAKTFGKYVQPSTAILSGIARDDLGLVLAEKIPKPHAQLLAVDYASLFGLPVKYAGFGVKTLENEASFAKQKPYPDAPRVGEGIIIPCPKRDTFGTVICVAAKCSNSLQASRRGDSGGPLVQDGRVVGVVKGHTSRTVRLGTCYTPVSIYLHWIKHVMSTKGL